ncbi:hypothetical protein AC249_AIPGENE22186 [Exaiptasia diaphana]|nr:hypothetical protein AC249_AIPGENE22186 [Exaiptasia diaphana]
MSLALQKTIPSEAHKNPPPQIIARRKTLNSKDIFLRFYFIAQAVNRPKYSRTNSDIIRSDVMVARYVKIASGDEIGPEKIYRLPNSQKISIASIILIVRYFQHGLKYRNIRVQTFIKPPMATQLED